MIDLPWTFFFQTCWGSGVPLLRQLMTKEWPRITWVSLGSKIQDGATMLRKDVTKIGKCVGWVGRHLYKNKTKLQNLQFKLEKFILNTETVIPSLSLQPILMLIQHKRNSVNKATFKWTPNEPLTGWRRADAHYCHVNKKQRGKEEHTWRALASSQQQTDEPKTS